MRLFKRAASLFLAAALSLGMSVTAFAAPADTGFSDVAPDAWYSEAVTYVRGNDLMNGTSDTTFSPDTNMTRAMLAMVLYRLAGEPSLENENLGYPFSDAPGDSWYADGVYWARLAGVMEGYGDDCFGPSAPVTREQIAAILWRYAGSPTVGASLDFADEDAIPSWAADAVDWARTSGVIDGREGNRFAPQASATRAEVAMILMRYVEGQTEPGTEPEPTPAPGASPEPEADTDVLVAYFSATGNTGNIAEHLAAILDADLYEIVPEDPYTAEDLDYRDSDSRATQEQNDPTARPAISGDVENMENYEVIFLGYPIWWGDAPRIISTFLESYDFDGKTIVPFCTSGSSSIGSSAKELEEVTRGVTWLDGQRFSGSASLDTVEQWVDSLGLDLALAA